MKAKRFFLIIVISLLFAVSTSVVASANGELPPEPPIPDPECGSYTHKNYRPDTYGNYRVEGLEGGPFTITSFNGWHIVGAQWLDDFDAALASYTYPPGTTSVMIILPFGGALSLSVTLQKNCVCRPTGNYVYTLLGNYPCNLITKENSIPARFLDPEYTGPLCNLPTFDHVWNGDWVKNEELDCGGYFVGGNHYDTSLGNLP